MNREHLKHLLAQVQSGDVDLDTAMQRLKKLPFEDLGYAKVDFHRHMRAGVAEVIYCEGKSLEHIRGITAKLAQHHDNILATRADRDVFECIREVVTDSEYHEIARIAVIKPRPTPC